MQEKQDKEGKQGRLNERGRKMMTEREKGFYYKRIRQELRSQRKAIQ